MVPVLPFVGMQIDQALAQMETCQLTCTEADIQWVASDKPLGTILTQTLEAGTEAEAWSTIGFTVSGGSGGAPAGPGTGGGTGGTGSGSGRVERDVSIELPQDGRDSVLVEVYVGSETAPQARGTGYPADGYFQCRLKGSGTQIIHVFFDGVAAPDKSQLVRFS